MEIVAVAILWSLDGLSRHCLECSFHNCAGLYACSSFNASDVFHKMHDELSKPCSPPQCARSQDPVKWGRIKQPLITIKTPQ